MDGLAILSTTVVISNRKTESLVWYVWPSSCHDMTYTDQLFFEGQHCVNVKLNKGSPLCMNQKHCVYMSSNIDHKKSHI